ncbi:MAG: hypothetical protein WDA08_05090 [Weeksellaceae bacterium]
MKAFWNASRTIYPAVFRVLIGLVLLVDLFFTLPALPYLLNPEINSLVADKGLYAWLSENYQIYFSIYGIVLFLFIFGIGKNLVSFLVWACYFLLFQMTRFSSTWGDLILHFTLLYFVLVDSFRFLSMIKTKSRFGFVSKLAVCSVILHLFLIYIDNAFYKITDQHWRQGISVYYSFSQYPDFKESIWYPLVSHGLITRFINYFVIMQQAFFVPLVLWKKTRIWMLALTAFIHSIMFVEFGLWKFEIVMILLLGFVFTDDEWKFFLRKWVSPTLFKV